MTSPKENCSICFETIEKDCLTTPCCHHFHKSCLDSWMSVQKSCPNCRTEINYFPKISFTICSICQLELGNICFTTSCFHKFHHNCLHRWLRKYSCRCPDCRKLICLEDETFSSKNENHEIEEENTPPPINWNLSVSNDDYEEEETRIPPSGIPRTESGGAKDKPILIEDSGTESEKDPFSWSSEEEEEVEDFMEQEASQNFIPNSPNYCPSSPHYTPSLSNYDPSSDTEENESSISEMTCKDFTKSIYKESKNIKKILKRKCKNFKKYPRTRSSLRHISKLYEVSKKMSEIIELLEY